MGLAGWGRVSPTRAVVNPARAGGMVGRALSKAVRKQFGWQDKTAHVDLHPERSYGVFRDNHTTRMSRIVQVTVTNISPGPSAYAEEYPSSDASYSQKRQATDDTSNDGNYIVWFLWLAALRALLCW